jgi:hypothetical protein
MRVTKSDKVILECFQNGIDLPDGNIIINNLGLPEIAEQISTHKGIGKSSVYYAVNKLHGMGLLKQTEGRGYRTPRRYAIIDKNKEIEKRNILRSKKERSFQTIKMLKELKIDVSIEDFIFEDDSPLFLKIDVEKLFSSLNGNILVKKDTLDGIFNN